MRGKEVRKVGNQLALLLPNFYVMEFSTLTSTLPGITAAVVNSPERSWSRDESFP
jgi:hypothetical protein